MPIDRGFDEAPVEDVPLEDGPTESDGPTDSPVEDGQG